MLPGINGIYSRIVYLRVRWAKRQRSRTSGRNAYIYQEQHFYPFSSCLAGIQNAKPLNGFWRCRNVRTPPSGDNWKSQNLKVSVYTGTYPCPIVLRWSWMGTWMCPWFDATISIVHNLWQNSSVSFFHGYHHHWEKRILPYHHYGSKVLPIGTVSHPSNVFSYASISHCSWRTRGGRWDTCEADPLASSALPCAWSDWHKNYDKLDIASFSLAYWFWCYGGYSPRHRQQMKDQPLLKLVKWNVKVMQMKKFPMQKRNLP